MDSNLDLDGAILKASDLVIAHLLEKGKAIHPKAVDVRNHFLEAVKIKRQRRLESRAASNRLRLCPPEISWTRFEPSY